MRAAATANTERTVGPYVIEVSDDFAYSDPVDGSVAKKQSVRFLVVDGSRVIFHLSVTRGSGATGRIYIEQYQNDPTKLDATVSVCDIKTFCGTETPTVMT